MKRICQENQFQTEIGRMADQGVKSAALQSLSGAQRHVRAEGSSQRKDCHGANSQTENQHSEGHRPQPAITAWHVDREKLVHPSDYIERCKNDNPKKYLRPAILYLALPPARCCDQGDEDFSHGPYSC